MVRLKIIGAVLAIGAALAACGTPRTEHAVGNNAEPKLTLLTPEQQAILQDGVKPNVVYDAVDGGHVAEL